MFLNVLASSKSLNQNCLKDNCSDRKQPRRCIFEALFIPSFYFSSAHSPLQSFSPSLIFLLPSFLLSTFLLLSTGLAFFAMGPLFLPSPQSFSARPLYFLPPSSCLILDLLISGIVGREAINHAELSFGNLIRWQGPTPYLNNAKENFSIRSSSPNVPFDDAFLTSTQILSLSSNFVAKFSPAVQSDRKSLLPEKRLIFISLTFFRCSSGSGNCGLRRTVHLEQLSAFLASISRSRVSCPELKKTTQDFPPENGLFKCESCEGWRE